MASNDKNNAQKKYRSAQANKDLVRYELQIKADSKARFEALVKAVADELDGPWDERRRLAKARTQVFDNITQNVLQQFSGLQTQIEHLKEEIKALSPSFFIDLQQSTVLPEAIAALPDDPKQLKAILAKTYAESQQAKQLAQKLKSRAEQYRQLHEVSSRYNDELRAQLTEAGIWAGD